MPSGPNASFHLDHDKRGEMSAVDGSQLIGGVDNNLAEADKR